MTKEKITQTAYVKAWQKFKESDEYKGLVNADTISLPLKNKIYLENRIRTAFDAGYNSK